MKKRLLFVLFFASLLLLACASGKEKQNMGSVPECNSIPHELDEEGRCIYCKEQCVEYTYGNTKYTGPVNSDKDYVTVNMVNEQGEKCIYKVYGQKRNDFGMYTEFIAQHGCAVSSLTCVLNMKVPSLASYTPDMTISLVENKVLGEEIYRKNYDRPVEKQMPVSMYGASKILSAFDVDHEYVPSYNEGDAVNEIRDNLEKGNPVIIIVGESDGKWSEYSHVMLLIGLNEQGDAIVCDTYDREWAGENQRIKFAHVEELVGYMWSEQKEPEGVYWGKSGGISGYILIR